ncbi:MAG: amidohydrolase family protein [Stellaceae bacterium]|jgi:predicted TIM-barrel fold metal-dependent hydrolase
MRCDSHVHIVGDLARYQQPADRRYTAGVADLATLRALAARRGIARFVIMQPSFYLADNSLLLESLDALEGQGRGVATINPAKADPGRMAEYHARGVRGLRINLYSPADGKAPPLALIFDATAALAQRQGWHVEVIAPLPVLLAASEVLARSKVPVVIDHFGLFAGFTPNSETGKGLLALLGLPHVWIKLSAPYRCSADATATKPDPAWLAAILGAAAERCVWGSDWPHTPRHEDQTGNAVAVPYRDLRYEEVVDGFLAALPSTATADMILDRNPAALYGFPHKG